MYSFGRVQSQASDQQLTQIDRSKSEDFVINWLKPSQPCAALSSSLTH